VKKRTYIIIGAIFLISSLIFIWGVNYLKGIDLFSPDNTFYVEYKNVSGLKVSNSVTINGFVIGQVRDIKLKPDYSGVIVKLSIKKDYLIPKSSVAEIYSLDIMGTKGVRIIFSDQNDYLKTGDTLQGIIEKDLKEQVNAEILPLKKKTEEMIASFDSAATIIQNIFDKSARRNLRLSFESIKKTLKTLEQTTFTFDTLLTSEKSKITIFMDNIVSISKNLKNNNDKISKVIENFAQISDSLAKVNFVKTIEKTNQTLEETYAILDKINRGEGSLGLLLNNDTLYYNLQNSAKDLDILLKDIKENPKRYLHFSIFDLGRTVVVSEDKNKKGK